MAELVGLMFCYLVIVLQNKPRYQECIIFILLTIQCALSYCLLSKIITDILLWLVLMVVIDLVISLLICFTYLSRTMTIVTIITVPCLMYNIVSYLDTTCYSYYLNLFIADHYLQGMLLLIHIDKPYLNIFIKILLLGTTLI